MARFCPVEAADVSQSTVILFRKGSSHNPSTSSVYSVPGPLLGLILQGLGKGAQALFLPAFDFLYILVLSSELNFVLPPLPPP